MADSFQFNAETLSRTAEPLGYDVTDVLISSYSLGGSGQDDAGPPAGFTTEGNETQIALLLPAVQQAREAARRTTCATECDDAAPDGFTVADGGADWGF